MDAVREFLLERAEVDVVALVQCTSPFVQPRFLAQGDNSTERNFVQVWVEKRIDSPIRFCYMPLLLSF